MDKEYINAFNDITSATKSLIDDIDESVVKNQNALDYSNSHSDDLHVKFKLDAAYSQGWEDCKKYLLNRVSRVQ